MTEILLLLLSAGLIGACGVFVAAEFSFVTVDRGAVDRAVAAGERGAAGVQSALRSLSTQLSGAQVGITLTNLTIGFLAEPAIARLVDGPLSAIGLSERAVRPTSVALSLLLATGATMVFGELVPKNLAIAEPMRVARATQAYQRGFTRAVGPLIRALNGSANGLLRLVGIEPQEELRSARNARELASLVRRSADEGALDRGTATLVERSISFGPRMAAEIMTPRVRMATVEADRASSSVIAVAKASGRSRFPVIEGDADTVVGMIHVKQVVALPADERGRVKVRQLMTAPTIIPGTLRLDPLLRLLRDDPLQLAVVADEYGGTAGLVTLEDVIEEIVGDISDEHDRLGGGLRRRVDGGWTVSGLLRPDEVADATGIRLPEDDDYDTVAGLVIACLGRLARPGDRVEVELPSELAEDSDRMLRRRAVLVVDRVEGRRVDRLTLRVREDWVDG
ncbi:MAG: hemolysin family protein [Nocardioidaceae bacterium]